MLLLVFFFLSRGRPQISNMTAILCPDTTLFRSSGRGRPRPSESQSRRFPRQGRLSRAARARAAAGDALHAHGDGQYRQGRRGALPDGQLPDRRRSEEHTSELQSLMRTSYAVFCLKKNRKRKEIERTTINYN